MHKAMTATVLLAAALAVGCGGWAFGPAEAPAAPPAAAPADAAGREVMAYVNNQPIYMDRLNELLLRSHGLDIAQQLIALELVRQEAARQGVTVTAEDVERQETELIRRIFPDIDSPAQRQRALEQIRMQRGLSEGEWRVIVERNAYQTALARPHVEVTEEDLREAFREQYGRKVVVRHIQVPSLLEAQRVLEALREGADFARLARERSTNLSRDRGGLLPPIGEGTEAVPLAFRQAALALDEVGEVSEPVQVMSTFHILKLERIVEPEEATFAEVRDELARRVREQELERLRQRILADLIANAQAEGRIRYANPVLAEQAETPPGAQP